MTQMPTEEELAMQNQKAAEQAALEGQMMQSLPMQGAGQSSAGSGSGSGNATQLAEQMASMRSPAA